MCVCTVGKPIIKAGGEPGKVSGGERTLSLIGFLQEGRRMWKVKTALGREVNFQPLCSDFPPVNSTRFYVLK